MKKSSIFVFAVLLTTMMTYSCNRNCKGGGWYGDRNLGFAPVQEKPVDASNPILCEEIETCNISNP